jgi:hypothetical protein
MSTSVIRKYKTSDGSVKVRKYDTINGVPATTYRREQNRKYRQKKRETRPPRLRRTPASQADIMPPHTRAEIIRQHSDGVPLRQMERDTGISRYILRRVINKHFDNAP